MRLRRKSPAPTTRMRENATCEMTNTRASGFRLRSLHRYPSETSRKLLPIKLAAIRHSTFRFRAIGAASAVDLCLQTEQCLRIAQLPSQIGWHRCGIPEKARENASIRRQDGVFAVEGVKLGRALRSDPVISRCLCLRFTAEGVHWLRHAIWAIRSPAASPRRSPTTHSASIRRVRSM